MQFSKMHALGNDFMVVDGVTQAVRLNTKVIQALGDRHRGIGFDQLLLIEPPYNPDTDFHYRIFNADGSEVNQCGNGARCFALYVTLQGLINKKDIRVTTNNGSMILSMIGDHKVKVNMGSPRWQPKQIPFQANKVEKKYLLLTKTAGAVMAGVVSMGNPHCVVIVDDLSSTNVASLGYQLEHHERFPEKTNVPFMEIISPTEVKVRVWERGCGETQACGSGCCGAVAVGINNGQLSKTEPVTVHTLGGDLTIEWNGEESSPLYMTGPATYVYSGYIDNNTLKQMLLETPNSL